jgi:hypothetical protein
MPGAVPESLEFRNAWQVPRQEPECAISWTWSIRHVWRK